jgi:hypothetical protein
LCGSPSGSQSTLLFRVAALANKVWLRSDSAVGCVGEILVCECSFPNRFSDFPAPLHANSGGETSSVRRPMPPIQKYGKCMCTHTPNSLTKEVSPFVCFDTLVY